MNNSCKCGGSCSNKELELYKSLILRQEECLEAYEHLDVFRDGTNAYNNILQDINNLKGQCVIIKAEIKKRQEDKL